MQIDILGRNKSYLMRIKGCTIKYYTSQSLYFSGNTRPNFTNFYVSVACGRSLVMLRWYCNTLWVMYFRFCGWRRVFL